MQKLVALRRLSAVRIPRLSFVSSVFRTTAGNGPVRSGDEIVAGFTPSSETVCFKVRGNLISTTDGLGECHYYQRAFSNSPEYTHINPDASTRYHYLL